MSALGPGDLAPGDGVVYDPGYGAPKKNGVVTSLSRDTGTVFVRYSGQHPGAPGKATRISDLERTSSRG